MKEIYSRILGVVKLLDGIWSFYIITTTTVSQLKNIPEDFYTSLGNFIGLGFIYVYCAYLLYSGLTDLLIKPFKKRILRIGIFLGILISLVMIYLVFFGAYEKDGQLILAGYTCITVSIIIRDTYRIYKTKKETNI